MLTPFDDCFEGLVPLKEALAFGFRVEMEILFPFWEKIGERPRKGPFSPIGLEDTLRNKQLESQR